MVNFFGLFSVDMQYVIIAVLVMGIISIVSLILAIVAICKMGHTRKKYENFMEGKDARSLEPLLKERFKEIEDLKRINAKNVKNIKFLLDKIHYSYQKVGIVKYDAFHEMGGKLSFALTMLDNKNNGFIINSMHSREGCYMYIKEIVAGESYIELGEEEAESLEKAIIEETDIHSNITVVQLVNERRLVADTDVGKQIRKDIVDLEQLLDAYRRGLLREKR